MGSCRPFSVSSELFLRPRTSSRRASELLPNFFWASGPFLGPRAFSSASGLFWAFCGLLLRNPYKRPRTSPEKARPRKLRRGPEAQKGSGQEKVGPRKIPKEARSPTEAGKSSRKQEKAQKRPEDQKCCPKNRQTSTNQKLSFRKGKCAKRVQVEFFFLRQTADKNTKTDCFSAPKG